MDKINKVKSMSIWIFIIPFLAVNTCLIMITQFHELYPNREEIIHWTFLLLPNILSSALLPRRAIDKEMRLKELFGHSVCPPVKEIYRPILIADFLIIPSGRETTSEEPNEFIIPLTTVSKFISQIVSLF